MKWFRHRKARSDRGAGLAFAWRIPTTRIGSTLVGLVVVGLVAVVLGTMVKVRVLSPPARSAQRGSVVLATGEGVTAWLARRGAELTPFPAPLAVMEFDQTGRALAAHPAFVGADRGGYRPSLRALPELPEVAGAADVSLGELPPLPALGELAGEPPAVVRELRPVLRPDAAGLAERLRVPLPEFQLPAGAVAPERGLRFMLELDAGGQVVTAVPMGGLKAEAMVEAAERWLRGLRFDPAEAAPEWFAVEVRFISVTDD